MGKKRFEFSAETQKLYEQFKQADEQLKTHWDAFLEANRAAVEYLDKVVEYRNALVSGLKQKMREEVQTIDPEIFGKSHQLGSISVSCGESWWYDAERFLAMIEEVGLRAEADEAGCITTTTAVDKEKAKEFCEKRDLEARLKRCRESKQTTPAVKGLKKIAEFLEEID